MQMKKHMPVIAMIFTQFTIAGVLLLSKAVISSGMKPSIFITYRQAIATLVLAPFAFYYERKNAPTLTTFLLCKIFIVSSFGIALSLNLTYAGFKYVSATFAAAFTIMIPTMVFIIAVCSRIESLAITQKQGMAKVLGTIFGLIGAMIYTFYKGPPLYSSSKIEALNAFAKTHSKDEWIKGSLFLFISTLAWSIWLVLQTPLLKQYPAKLRLSALQFGFSCITSTIYSAIVERDISSWKLGWDINLLSVIYSGIFVTGVTFTIQVWVIEKRGPVFVAIFNPLALVLTAIFSTLIFHEILHWGSVIGGCILAVGLYVFLWGKNKEVQKEFDNLKDEDCIESIGTSTNEHKTQIPEII